MRYKANSTGVAHNLSLPQMPIDLLPEDEVFKAFHNPEDRVQMVGFGGLSAIGKITILANGQAQIDVTHAKYLNVGHQALATSISTDNEAPAPTGDYFFNHFGQILKTPELGWVDHKEITTTFEGNRLAAFEMLLTGERSGGWVALRGADGKFRRVATGHLMFAAVGFLESYQLSTLARSCSKVTHGFVTFLYSMLDYTPSGRHVLTLMNQVENLYVKGGDVLLNYLRTSEGE